MRGSWWRRHDECAPASCCGLGGAVAEVLGERRPTPLRRVGLKDVYGESAPNDYLLDAYGISAPHIAAAARELAGAG